jgi:two-component system sensor histidine kinase ComP
VERRQVCESQKGACGPVLFHAVRELLVNVIKHAAAQTAVVRFDRCNGENIVTVEDDGCGFDPHGALASQATNKGFGLLNIKQKIEIVGGRYKIHSTVGTGTSVMVTIPAGCCSGGK